MNKRPIERNDFRIRRFAAVLLAGGASKRMGRDKALLPMRWLGRDMPLWERQLTILQELGPKELMISGSPKAGYPSSVPILPDAWKNAGPLGGIATCLHAIESELLLVLAVDLPQIEPSFLRELLFQAEENLGVVPVRNALFEPLAAIYPKTAFPEAVRRLERRELKLQEFVRELVDSCRVKLLEVPLALQNQLINWNTSEDMSG